MVLNNQCNYYPLQKIKTMDYLIPLPYEILKLVHCFYNDYGKEPKTLALEPKRAKKEPKRASFYKFNYGGKHG
jgi:hypothetical protein